MPNPNKNRTPQQILDHWPHPIPQPDTEEARRARVGQRFRLYFLGPVDSRLAALGKKLATPAKGQRARALLTEAESMKALMLEPQNVFLAIDHGQHVETLLTELRALVG